MPIQYKGRYGGMHMRRYGRRVYSQFKERVGPQGGKYFIRGRDRHKVYHSNIKTRNLGFTGHTNKLGRKVYGGVRGGYRVIHHKVSRNNGGILRRQVLFLRPKMNKSFFMRI